MTLRKKTTTPSVSFASRRLAPSLLLSLTMAFGALTADLANGSMSSPVAFAKKKKKATKDEPAAEEKKDAKASAQTEKPSEKGAAAAKSEPEKKDEKLRTTGPAQIKRDAFSSKQFDNSAKADKKRDEQIIEIKSLLPKMRGKSQEGELVFRLAEIYWDKSKFSYQNEFKDFDAAYTKWVDGGRAGKEPLLPAFTKKSDVYKKQALDNYRVVLDKFPDYPRLDEVLYIMAYNEYEAGKHKEAIDNYSQLIRQYPKSEYVSDAYLALGEHYFKSNDLQKSTKAYKKAYDIGEERKRPSVSNYALYKLAWCDYNAQAYDDALSKFKDVIKRSGKTTASKDGAGGTERLQLKREALNDMVLTYSQLDVSKDAYEYLKKEAGAEEAYRLTGKLAAVYKEQGKHAIQIDTLRLLVSIDQDNAQAPDYQSSIVQAYSNLGDRPAVKKEVTRLVELYRPGSAWWRKNENNQANVERARAIAESRLRELVTDYHRYAQKFKKYDDYEVAASIYDQYLKAFPDADQAYRLNFFYAELLWDLGKWREAAAQYDAVVKRDPKGEYTRTCAYNAVLAWEKIVNGVEPPPVSKDGKIAINDCTPEDEKAGKCKVKKNDGEIKKEKVVIEKLDKSKKGSAKYDAQPIPPDEVALAAACDAYVAVVPEKELTDAKLREELQVVKFKAAYIYQSRYHFDEGAKRYGELIERWPESDYARKGADQILDSYAFRENYEALEKWSRTFADKKELMKDGKFAQSVMDFMEGASFKNIDTMREKSEASKDETIALSAASKFNGFVKEFPKSKLAPLAVYNMQMLYANHRELDLALSAADRLLKDYPKEIAAYKFTVGEKDQDLKNKLEVDTYANIPAYYEKTAQYRQAAEWYVKFADKYKDNPKSPDSIYNAGIFYLGFGDKKAAAAMFARYLKDFPKQKDVADVYLRMVAVYEDDEDWKKAATLYAEFEKAHGKDAKPEQLLLARYKTAYSLQKSGKDKEMVQACQDLIGSFKKLDEKVRKSDTGALAGGYCGYHVLEAEWQEYKAIKIEVRAGTSGKKGMKLVAEALDQKKKRRDDIAKKYYDLKDYGSGEWAVAGLLRAADALIDYVDTLRQAPDPAMLANNPEALDIFRTELENVAFPVEEQAIQALDAALETAFKLGIYSPYTIEIEERLKRYKPSRFPRVYELQFFPSTTVVAPTRTASR